ncbi:MAG: DUF4115 domain-containing protein [Candidatus Omnitrophica bacterium]|nr:DUF4115 domain-containing protein [Candidatus Omnitrophota bacterium]
MESIGARLKKIRLEKGVSLEEIQKRTKIHPNILKSIEGDSLSDINPVYLKGFLKIYCNSLGIDPKDYIVDHKEARTYSKIAKVVNSEDQEPSLKKKETTSFKANPINLSSFRPSKTVKKAIVLGLVVIVIGFGLIKIVKFISFKHKENLAKKAIISQSLSKAPGKEQKPTKPSKKSAKQQTSKSKASTVNEQKVQAKETPRIVEATTKKEVIPLNKESMQGIRLGIRALENCWISLRVDGRVVFQRVLEKGRFESWQAKDKMELSLGNAGVVEVEVNGQRFESLGRKGQSLKNILVNKEGLNINR